MKKEESVTIQIPEIKIQRAKIKIVGDSPLLVCKFSEKAKREMLSKDMKKAKKIKETKNPFAEFMHSLHWITKEPDTEDKTPEECQKIFEEELKNGAKFGFPATGIKQSAISAMYRSGLSKNKVMLQGLFHIEGKLVEIKGDLSMNEEVARNPSTGAAMILYRGEYAKGWTAEFSVIYKKDNVSLEQIIQMINLGGFDVGIGEWRVEKSGNYGMFHCE